MLQVEGSKLAYQDLFKKTNFLTQAKQGTFYESHIIKGNYKCKGFEMLACLAVYSYTSAFAAC